VSTDINIKQRASECIAHGALTNSKRPSCHIEGVYPTHIKSAHGCEVTDSDGKKYVDFICGLGTNVFGSNNETINRVMIQAMGDGVIHSLPTTLEVRVAEKLLGVIPWCKRVRFLKTGSEATAAAIRIARTYTNRSLVLSEGYHSWHDDFVSLTPPAKGVPPRTWMDTLKNKRFLSSAAAVIVEPVMLDCSPERIKWLRELQADCKESGTLLIFDEVITGFRFPEVTFSKTHGFKPDLICLGKGMANGMPLACVAGSKEIMESDYFISSTYAGETVSLAACSAVLDLIHKQPLHNLWRIGTEFTEGFNSLWPEKISIAGYATRGSFVGDADVKNLFFQEACIAGLLFGPSWFIGYSHEKHIKAALNTCSDILMRIRQGAVKLKGKTPKSPYAERVRNGSSRTTSECEEVERDETRDHRSPGEVQPDVPSLPSVGEGDVRVPRRGQAEVRHP